MIHNKRAQAAWKELIGGKLSMNGAGTLGLTAMIAPPTTRARWLEQLRNTGNFAYIDAFLKNTFPKAHMVPRRERIWHGSTSTDMWTAMREKFAEEIMQKKGPGVALDEGYIFSDAGRGFDGSISLRLEAWWRTAWTGSSRRLKKKS